MKNLFTLAACMVGLFSLAQNKNIRCYTVEDDSMLRLKYGLESKEDFELWMQYKMAQYKASPQYKSGQRNVITLPIIFHVIHNGDAVGSGENLSQAQINSQIDVLNEDFRRLAGTPGFNTNPVGADCEIEFCPAVVDPNGNVLAQPGIDRVNLGQADWTQTTINSTVKPQTIWDPERYVNVWTVRFGGSSSSLLGYAQFPSSSGLAGLNANGGAANTDGVVVRFNATGRVGTLDATYNEGRTLTHELGHWLGLRHIWGDQTCGNDYCDDTPTSDGSNYGCPQGQNTCNEGGSNPPDMVENYMDYTDDDCMNVFTQDQKDRMMVVMANSPRRANLVNSNVCTVPFTFSYTGQVIDASTNQGIANAKVFFDGPADYTPTTDANGFFTISNLQQDNYTVYAGKWGYVTGTLSSQAYNPNTPPITIALNEGYYDDFLLDFGWSESGTATTGKWERGRPTGTTFTSNSVTYNSNPGSDVTGDYGVNAFVTGLGGGGAGDFDVDGGTTTLASPVMNLSNYTNPLLSYYRWFFNAGGSGNANDSLIISLVNGTQVIDIDRVGPSVNNNTWTFRSYRIKDYIANPGNNITFRARTFDQSSTGHLVEAGIDLFRVVDSTASSAVPPVANFASNNTTVCTGEPVVFNDLSTNNPTQWQWSFPGGSPSSSTSSNPSVTYAQPGTYNVSLTVSNGAGNNSTTQNAFITVNAVVAQFSVNNAGICPGESVTFTSESSCNPTTLQWVFNGGDPAVSTLSNPEVTYSSPGIYDVVLIAGNAAGADTLLQNLAVQVFSPPVITATAVNDVNGQSQGSATVNVSSGTPPYTYNWNTTPAQTGPTANGLSAGLYNVTVTDGNGCRAITSVTVENSGATTLSDIDRSPILSIYPNPSAGLLTLTVGQATDVTLYDATGRLVYETAIKPGSQTLNLSQLAKGVYTLRAANQAMKWVKE